LKQCIISVFAFEKQVDSPLIRPPLTGSVQKAQLEYRLGSLGPDSPIFRPFSFELNKK